MDIRKAAERAAESLKEPGEGILYSRRRSDGQYVDIHHTGEVRRVVRIVLTTSGLIEENTQLLCLLEEALRWAEHSDACEGGWTWSPEGPFGDGEARPCTCWVQEARSLLNTKEDST